MTEGVDPSAETRPDERAPLPADRSPKPIQGQRRLIGGALLAFLVLGAVGFSIGRGDREPDASTAVGSASSTDVALDLPAGWRRTERAPAIPGLELTQAMTLAAGPGHDAGLTVGRVERPGDGLLPRSFTTRAEPAPGAQDPVRTEHLQGLRQRALRVRGYDGTLDVLASPTSRATIAFVCFFPSAASAERTECERVVASARLIGAKAGEVGPSSGYARRLNAAMKRLNGAVRARRQALMGSATRRGQSQAAAGLGRVYDDAAGDVKAIVPRPLERAAHTSIEASLTRAGDAYRRLASAASSGPINRYDTARRAVTSSERGVRSALDGLKGLGYARPAGP